MELGQLHFCLLVKNLAASVDFYAKLGFTSIEGDAETWAVVSDGASTLGLYMNPHMSTSPVLNFRGGHIGKISEELMERGLEPKKEIKVSADGGGSATFCDPDGNVVFFDSSPSERKKQESK